MIEASAWRRLLAFSLLLGCMLTDGEDNTRHHYFAQVLRMAQALNVAGYTVGLFNTYDMEHIRDAYIAQQIEL